MHHVTKYFQAESLLSDFQTRVKRTASRKGSRKKFEFLRRSSELRNEVEGMAKTSSMESVESVSSIPILGEEEGMPIYVLSLDGGVVGNRNSYKSYPRDS